MFWLNYSKFKKTQKSLSYICKSAKFYEFYQPKFYEFYHCKFTQIKTTEEQREKCLNSFCEIICYVDKVYEYLFKLDIFLKSLFDFFGLRIHPKLKTNLLLFEVAINFNQI